MRVKKSSLILLSLISAMSLSGCHGESSSSSLTPSKPDSNDFNQVVEDEDAKAWILSTYNNFIKLNSMEVSSNIENYSCKDIRKFIPKKEDFNTSTMPDVNGEIIRKETRLDVDAKLDQKISFLGMNATDPNDIKVSYSANNIYCSLTKDGLNPSDSDTAILDNGVAEMYIKDNLQYANLSDPNLRNFFPYVLYGFGDYETIDLAKKECDKLPEKFYDPTPIFEASDLPLNEKMTSIGGVSMDVALMKMINKNKEMDARFLEFRSDGENLKVQFRLRKKHLVQLAMNIKDEEGKLLTEEEAKAIIDNFVVINSFNVEVFINKNYYVDFIDADIDLAVSIPVKEENSTSELDAIDSYSIDMLTHSWFNFQDPVVVYPEDIKSYQEYDLKMPEIKLPDIGGGEGNSPFEPF